MENRPSFIASDDMLNELTEIVAKIVFDWAQQRESGYDLDEIKETVKKILDFHSNDNGYELAKEFEDELRISPDVELCELLDNVGRERYTIEKEYIRKWVEKNNVEPELGIDTTVETWVRGKKVQGVIKKIYKETAEYGVNVPTLDATGLYVIPYEKCTKIG